MAAGARVIFIVGVNAPARPPASENSRTGCARKAAAWCSAPRTRFRAAAVEQLEIWAQRNGIEVINRNPAPIRPRWFTTRVAAAKARAADVVIVDTAGRLHTKSNLMAEL